MTRRISILFLSLLSSLYAYPQKRLVDTADFGKWAYVADPGISNDGKYVFFTIKDQPYQISTLVIKNASTSWEKRIVNGSLARFCQDNKTALVKVKDTLMLVKLGGSQVQFIPDVENFQLIQLKKEEWIVYNKINTPSGLILKNLKTGKQTLLDNAIEYLVHPNERSLLVTQIYKDKIGEEELVIYNPEMRTSKSIWHGAHPKNIIFDTKGNQIAFYTSPSPASNTLTTLNVVNLNTDETEKVTLNDLGTIEEMSFYPHAYDHYRFSNDGKRLFFSVQESGEQLFPNAGIKVTVWNYQDPSLQSKQSNPNSVKQEYLYSLNIKQRNWIALTENFETLSYSNKFSSKKNDDYIVVERIEGDINEFYWNPKSRQRVTLISTITGERKIVQHDSKDYLLKVEISPNGKYIVFYNSAIKNYQCYHIQTGEITNLTNSIKTNWNSYLSDPSIKIPAPLGIMGWLDTEQKVLIKDEKGIWEIDLTGQLKPINLAGPELVNRIIFPLISNETKIYHQGEVILLQGINLDNKNHGFYSLKIARGEKIKQIYEGPYQYQKNYTFYFPLLENSLVKAKKSNAYFINRQSASEAPNYFYTKNFKSFKDLTCVNPEKEYNWMTSELLTYTNSKGNKEEGVLLKPQNFDSTKKYPVIFTYYTESTSNLNKFYYPEANGGIINYPWYISNEYLIFIPDIKFDSLSTSGESAFRSVMAAVDHLGEKPWVNKNKIAAHGGSFGGFETNYILTKTGIFTAAMELAGPTDLAAMYGAVFMPYGHSQTQGFDVGLMRMGGSLWDKQANYLDNSAILHADKITTPLLIMHNPKDGSVPYSQGLSFFVALRRLQKKAWMLEYENENHIISGRNENARTDYQIRVRQFFDHYLKDRSMPKWMSIGIPASMKGIDDGLALDTIPPSPRLIDQSKPM